MTSSTENPDGAIPYFAWRLPGEAFGPQHLILADDVLSIAISHSENDSRTATAKFPYTAQRVAEGRYGCFIAAEIEGVVRLLFAGTVSKADTGTAGEQVSVDFIAINQNDDQLVANLLAPVAANPLLYVPQFGEASNLQDATNLLAAMTTQIEYDRVGNPHLASIFGDADKLVVATEDDVSADSFKRAQNGIPPCGCFLTITFSWTQRRTSEGNAGEAVQDEIDRISAHYGIGNGDGNFTFTPDFISNWPKPGSTIGSDWTVTDSYMIPWAGPGTKPKTPASRPPIGVWQEAKKTSGRAESAADNDDAQELTRVALEPTEFTYPSLSFFGVQAKERKEIVRIYVPFVGQQMIPGNGPPIFLNLEASDLDADENTPEHKSDTVYQAGVRVQDQGILWECQATHRSKSSLASDRIDTNRFSVTFGQTLWEPVLEWRGVLGATDVESVVTTAWGTNAVRHAIRRAITAIGFKARAVPVTARIPMRLAWQIDTRSTFRVETSIVPGGFVEGKVTDVGITFDGRSGDAYAELTFLAAIGTGAAPGSPEDADGDGEVDPGGDVAVAGPGGDWDLVKYIQPFSLPDYEMEHDIISATVNWIGIEQAVALGNPGQPIWDPYSLSNTSRSIYYPNIPGAPIAASDFLNEATTEISIAVKDAHEGSAIIHPVTVVVTQGWKGPKQVEL